MGGSGRYRGHGHADRRRHRAVRAATVPASSATNVLVQTDIEVTFSEPVALLGTWLDITCTVSGSHAAGVVSGGALSSPSIPPRTSQ